DDPEDVAGRPEREADRDARPRRALLGNEHGACGAERDAGQLDRDVDVVVEEAGEAGAAERDDGVAELHDEPYGRRGEEEPSRTRACRCHLRNGSFGRVPPLSALRRCALTPRARRALQPPVEGVAQATVIMYACTV